MRVDIAKRKPRFVLFLLALGSAGAAQDCEGGCTIHRMEDVRFPIDDSPHSIAVRQEKDTKVHVYFGGKGKLIRGGGDQGWINVTTFRRDDELCVAVSHGEWGEHCHAEDKDVFLGTYSPSEWIIDCNGSDCGTCRTHEMIGIIFRVEDLPTTMVIGRLEKGKIMRVSGRTSYFPLNDKQWHDVTLTSVGDNIRVRSSSLGLDFEVGRSLVDIVFEDEEGNLVPGIIGLGCEDSPPHPLSTSDPTSTSHQALALNLELTPQEVMAARLGRYHLHLHLDLHLHLPPNEEIDEKEAN